MCVIYLTENDTFNYYIASVQREVIFLPPLTEGEGRRSYAPAVKKSLSLKSERPSAPRGTLSGLSRAGEGGERRGRERGVVIGYSADDRFLGKI